MDNNEMIRFGEGIPFERIRRITGYLVGDVSRMNGAKQAEVRDRKKHDENTNNSDNQLELINEKSKRESHHSKK